KHGGPEAEKISDKTLREFISELGETLEDTLNVIHADNIAHSEEASMPNQISKIRDRLKTLEVRKKIEGQKENLPISGKDLIDLGVPEGSMVGKVKSIIKKAVLKHPNLSREEAFKIAGKVVATLLRRNQLKENQNEKIGDCRNEELVDDIFGSVSEFARQVELNGDNFLYQNIQVIYDPETDVHSFWKKNTIIKEIITEGSELPPELAKEAEMATKAAIGWIYAPPLRTMFLKIDKREKEHDSAFQSIRNFIQTVKKFHEKARKGAQKEVDVLVHEYYTWENMKNNVKHIKVHLSKDNNGTTTASSKPPFRELDGTFYNYGDWAEPNSEDPAISYNRLLKDNEL
ncbi:MAG TPA: hypothetical protein VNX68_08780, partial [Nitrosopumilaceae archaeon]|nr:hypothetical protein [Nitrosopumilaceae archaeon]